MSLVNLKTILNDAHRHRYAVGAFNVVNNIISEAVAEAAVETRSPVIFNVAEVHLPYMNLEQFCPYLLNLARMLDVPVCLNFDHGLTIENIRRAIDVGFTSIMFDGSHYEFEENMKRTHQVVEMCHPHGISVEAELGAVGGDEGGRLLGAADPSKYTDLQQAKVFVKETGVDALAVAIGNSHGRYKGEPDLDFERLNALNLSLDVPLVLHGGSGLSASDFRTSIEHGIAKVNYFTGMSEAALKTSKAFFDQPLTHYNDYLELNTRVKNSVRADVKKQMELFGSTGKAL